MACNENYCDIDAENTFEGEPVTRPEEYGIIVANVSRPERLAQLAEECAELGQAALKLRRAITGENPTPMSEAIAEHILCEEIADVLTCLEVAGDYILRVSAQEYIETVKKHKYARWAKRVSGKDGGQ